MTRRCLMPRSCSAAIKTTRSRYSWKSSPTRMDSHCCVPIRRLTRIASSAWHNSSTTSASWPAAARSRSCICAASTFTCCRRPVSYPAHSRKLSTACSRAGCIFESERYRTKKNRPTGRFFYALHVCSGLDVRIAHCLQTRNLGDPAGYDIGIIHVVQIVHVVDFLSLQCI